MRIYLLIYNLYSKRESEDQVSGELSQEIAKEDESKEKSEIDWYEEVNKVKFKGILSNASVYLSAYSIYKSERLD